MNSKVILDTNALIWLIADPTKLGSATKSLINEAETVYFSAVSILEIRIKMMLGKLQVEGDIIEICKKTGLEELPISAEHADGIKNLSSRLTSHDPFDRLLVAQSECEEVKLITSDQFLLKHAPGQTVDACN